MAITAENLAEKYKLTREVVDAYALRSQSKWGEAQAAGAFEAEIAPFEVKGKKGPTQFSVDEHPRPKTTLADLAKLKPIFKKDGVVTAGNASGICDGAAALIVASEEGVKLGGMTALARIVAYGVCGVDPKIMGIGPVPAMQGALKRAGLTMAQMDIVEINEAFSVQNLACAKGLELDSERLNVCGGAVALGHPLGASGARILGHLTHQLIRNKKRYAIGAACIGGGQGIAVIIERATS